MAKAANFRVGNLDFDASSGELHRTGALRRLEPRAADVLRVLCEQEGELVSRQQLLDQCWGEGQGSDEALTQAVAQIRRALQELGERDRITTLAKRGYRITLEGGEPEGVATTPRQWRRIVLPGAALVVAGFLLLLLIFPHEIRHSVRHALGFDTMSASPARH